MSQLVPEQFAATQKPTLEAFFSLTNKVVEGLEKLAQLNLQVLRATLTETQENVLKGLSTKDPGEWIAQRQTLTEAVPERITSYNRQVFDIVSGVQAESAQFAQAQGEAYNKRVETLVEDVAKSAPAGSEAAIAAWKSALSAGSALAETVQKSYQQAVQAAESNVEAAAVAASRATHRATERASAAAKSYDCRVGWTARPTGAPLDGTALCRWSWLRFQPASAAGSMNEDHHARTHPRRPAIDQRSSPATWVQHGCRDEHAGVCDSR